MFGSGNLGDEAMLVAARETLPAHRCIPWQWWGDRQLLNRLVKRRRRKHFLVAGGTLIHGGDTAWLDYIEMRATQGRQISFFGTGLAFHDDQITPDYPPYRRWCDVLQRADQIYLRGPQSVELCRQMGAPAEVFGDFAFLLHKPDIPAKEADRKDTIGLNFGNCLGDQEAFETACVTLVQHLARHHELVFHIVVDTDIEATERIVRRAALPPGTGRIERHYFDPNAFMYAIRDYRAFIGLKLHAAGLAMVAGVPTLMIAYKPKCRDFMAPLGERSHMLFDLPLDVDDLLARSDRLLTEPQDFVVLEQIAALAAQQRKILTRCFLSGVDT